MAVYYMTDNEPSALPVPRASPEDSYWVHARSPIACLVFLTPLLLCYEIGIYWLGGTRPEHLRNGADHWMRAWLHETGIGIDFLLPVLVISCLVLWQIWGDFSWRVAPDTLVGMYAESLLFAFGLLLLGQLQDLVFHQAQHVALLAAERPTLTDLSQRVVSFLGAGLYEEVLFRLCLLPIAYAIFRLLLLRPRWAAGAAILATSVVFALAHHIPPDAPFSILGVLEHASREPFNLTFRIFAGLFFAILFVTRGFGITVGCHAAYDVLVGVLLAIQTP